MASGASASIAAPRTLRVEFDATRLDAAAVSKLVCEAGLDIAEELPLTPPPATETPRANGLKRLNLACR